MIVRKTMGRVIAETPRNLWKPLGNPSGNPLEPPRNPLSNVPRQHSSSSQKHVLIMHVRERQDREGDRKANDATHKHHIISIK